MRSVLAATLLATAAVGAAPVQGDVVYAIDYTDPNFGSPGFVSAQGTISVAQLGPVSAGDITGYQITINSPGSPQFILTPSNSTAFVVGPPFLVAETDALRVNFAPFVLNTFQILTPDLFHSFGYYQDGVEAQRETSNGLDASYVVLAPVSVGGTFVVGDVVTVPEPSPLLLASTAFTLAGAAVVRRRRSKNPVRS